MSQIVVEAGSARVKRGGKAQTVDAVRLFEQAVRDAGYSKDELLELWVALEHAARGVSNVTHDARLAEYEQRRADDTESAGAARPQG